MNFWERWKARRYIGRTFKMAEPKVQLPAGFHCSELSVACDRCYLNYRLLCKANKGELRIALVKAWQQLDQANVKRPIVGWLVHTEHPGISFEPPIAGGVARSPLCVCGAPQKTAEKQEQAA